MAQPSEESVDSKSSGNSEHHGATRLQSVIWTVACLAIAVAFYYLLSHWK